jgi:hypothetical protein
LNFEINGNRWWLASKNNLYQELFAYVSALDNRQTYREADNLRFARLYGNYQQMGLGAYNYSKIEASYSVTNRVTLNVIQSLIDTVVSKITKNKPKATFLTSGGDFSLQRKAKKLTKFVEGIYSYSEFYEKAGMAFQDACIFGTGCIKIFIENGQIKTERVIISEIKVDDIEAYYGKPRQIHQEKFIEKSVLKAMFPEHEAQIDVASYPDSQSYGQSATAKDMIKVVESWHLQSGPDAKDGKHTICISTVTLFEEDYEKDYFPFVFFKWGERPVGFFGQGLCEQLQGIQLEINKILRTIQVSMHLVSVPKLLVEASSKIVSAHLNNRIGGVIKYAGTPPAYAPLGGIPPELFAHLDRLYQRAYEISGVSQLAAQSLKPAGLDSGKALREFNDLETERFMSVAKRYEKAFMDAAEVIIDMAKDLYESEGDFKVKAKDGKFVETISWKDVNMDADKYLMQIFPTSSLSNTPAARLADVQDLLAAGFISKEEGLKLLDFPDLEASLNLLNADSTNLEKIIETMMDKGEYFPPEPYQNLENAIRKTQQAYLMFKVQGAPEDRLELLRQFMEDAQNLLMRAQEKAPTPEEMTRELAEMGAATAAAQVAEGIEDEESLLIKGGIDLGEEAAAPEVPQEEIVEEVSEEEIVEEG